MLRDVIRKKHPEEWAEKSWVLLQDNNLAHWSLFVNIYLSKHNITTTEILPYSADLVPADFYRFFFG